MLSDIFLVKRIVNNYLTKWTFRNVLKYATQKTYFNLKGENRQFFIAIKYTMSSQASD